MIININHCWHQDGDHHPHLSLLSDLPLLLELRGGAGEGECHSDLFGLYHLTTDTREEGLRQGMVYRQLHDGHDKQFYIYRWQTWWNCTSATIRLFPLFPSLSESATSGGSMRSWERSVAD